MIKTNMGKTNIKCHGVAELMSDFCIITKSLVDTLMDNSYSQEEAWEEIERVINMSKMTEEEIEKEAMKKLAELLKEMTEETDEDKEEEVDE